MADAQLAVRLARVEKKVADFLSGYGRLIVSYLRTSNYAEDESGNPTAGAKLDAQGTALKVAAGNLQVGAHVLANMIQHYTATVTEIDKSPTITLSPAQPDTDYVVVAIASGWTGSPPVAANTPVYYVTKTTTTVEIFAVSYAAPGATVTYDVAIIRAP